MPVFGIDIDDRVAHFIVARHISVPRRLYCSARPFLRGIAYSDSLRSAVQCRLQSREFRSPAKDGGLVSECRARVLVRVCKGPRWLGGEGRRAPELRTLPARAVLARIWGVRNAV